MVANVSLISAVNGKSVPAQIYTGITQQNLDDFNENWVPDRFVWKGFKWNEVVEYFGGCSDSEMFSLICKGKLEGMMVITYGQKAVHRNYSNKYTYPRQELIYIDILEVAPWNQGIYKGIRRYKAVGQRLFAHAHLISRGIDKYNGRVGLHSLPESEDFYKKAIGMKNFGQDPKYEYFQYPFGNTVKSTK